MRASESHYDLLNLGIVSSVASVPINWVHDNLNISKCVPLLTRMPTLPIGYKVTALGGLTVVSKTFSYILIVICLG